MKKLALLLAAIFALAACKCPKTEETPSESVNSPDEWYMILVNIDNPLPGDFSVKLDECANGHKLDSRVCAAMAQMLADARSEGLKPIICSSYRSAEKQTELFENKVKSCVSDGYSREEAEKEAARWVAPPGTSEHQTGLAADIVSLDYQILDEKQEDTPEQKWLMENSYKYGFILRYPDSKSDITKINYEPWHYRYVGVEAAKAIFESGLCLEEYLAIENGE